MKILAFLLIFAVVYVLEKLVIAKQLKESKKVLAGVIIAFLLEVGGNLLYDLAFPPQPNVVIRQTPLAEQPTPVPNPSKPTVKPIIPVDPSIPTGVKMITPLDPSIPTSSKTITPVDPSIPTGAKMITPLDPSRW
ncbi:hypothetical protein ACYULU_08755 [Breznakiellaceae bacterium SP9]